MGGGQIHISSQTNNELDIINYMPKITYFRKVYKKHTNFGMESIQQSVEGTANFGNTARVLFNNSGSLINNVTFELVLPPVANVSGNGGFITNYGSYANWVNAVGYAIYNSIELKINGQSIDKHTGLWYDVINELSDPNNKEWSLVGKHNSNADMNSILTKKTKYYLPLKFFFNKQPGLSLPINVIGDKSIELIINFNNLNNLILYENSGATVASSNIISFNVYATYIFLEQSEENKIIQNLPTNYLIETLDYFENYNVNNVGNFSFENPVKEIIWVFRHNSRISTSNPRISNDISITNGNDIFNYSNTHINDTLGYNSYDVFSTLTIRIANEERFSSRDSMYFRKLQPYYYHSKVPNKNVYLYSFAIDPEEYQPSGTYNFSKNNDKTSFSFTGIPGHSNNGAVSSNYKINIFLPTYKYLNISYQGTSLSNVPILYDDSFIKV